MSLNLINHSKDLQQLRNEGFDIEIKHGHLLIHGIPYVNSQKNIAYGVLVTALDLAGESTVKPQDHVIHFIGEHPCDIEGNILKGIESPHNRRTLAENIEIDFSFSSKPRPEGYVDYYEKVTNYYQIISPHAEAIDSSVTAKTFKVRLIEEPEFPFHYPDSNSSRAEIYVISAKLSKLKIAIIGLGGTGAYVLDFVAKTPVKEINLFDGDDFLSHNAFRSPGTASIDELNKKPKKVAHLHNVYSKLHKFIIPHEYHLSSAVFEQLSDMDFVFICIDDSEAKKPIIDHLVKSGIPFADTGMGINTIDEKLAGMVRVTTVTKEKNNHVNTRISFSGKKDDDYDQNIQIAELNALNAALAVIKWKKMFGFYHDLAKEHNSLYTIDVGSLINDETNS